MNRLIICNVTDRQIEYAHAKMKRSLWEGLYLHDKKRLRCHISSGWGAQTGDPGSADGPLKRRQILKLLRRETFGARDERTKGAWVSIIRSALSVGCQERQRANVYWKAHLQIMSAVSLPLSGPSKDIGEGKATFNPDALVLGTDRIKVKEIVISLRNVNLFLGEL